MSKQQIMSHPAETESKWLNRAGGISGILIGIGYIVIIALYVPLGAPPNGAEAKLESIAGNTTIWWAILALSVLTDLLFVPLAFALYAALQKINRAVMLLSVTFILLFVFLDLALTWTNYAVLIALSGNYLAAANDAQRAASIAAATYPSMVLESKLLFVYNSLTLALGILLTGFVMLRADLGKSATYLGLLGIVAVVGSFFSSALDFTIILVSVLTTIWVLLVGYRLYRGSEISI